MFHCADAIKGSEDGDQHPVEYLNSIDIASLPPPHLKVKPGVPLMLLRDMDQRQGLCNGTRLRLVRMKNRVLEVRIITGPHAGETVLIPKSKLTPRSQPMSSYPLYSSLMFHRSQAPISITAKHPSPSQPSTSPRYNFRHSCAQPRR